MLCVVKLHLLLLLLLLFVVVRARARVRRVPGANAASLPLSLSWQVVMMSARTQTPPCLRPNHHSRTHTTHSYTSKAFVEATHWQSEPFKAFMETMDADATWLTKSITTDTEADAGF